MKITLAPGTPVPAYAKPGDAAFDLTLNLAAPVTLAPGETAWVSCGIAMEIPAGHFGLLVPRSSLAKRGLMLANTLGVIDNGYRGEVSAALRNLGAAAEVLNHGDRLLQMAIVPFTQVSFEPAQSLSATARGGGGYGSTGLR